LTEGLETGILKLRKGGDMKKVFDCSPWPPYKAKVNPGLRLRIKGKNKFFSFFFRRKT
jgi:hypothetical protein